MRELSLISGCPSVGNDWNCRLITNLPGDVVRSLQAKLSQAGRP